jgi:hypothetical protein
MNAKAFGGGRRDFAMSFRWGKKTGVLVFLCLPTLFVDEFRVCCREVLDFSFEVHREAADCV